MISLTTGKQHLTGQTAIIGGQTVRLATPSGTLLKAGSTLTGQGGKQIILQKQGTGQPQIVTLVKTSQGMQVSILDFGDLELLKSMRANLLRCRHSVT